ncbi:MAG: CBS domain-containing protein [Arenicella sp.]
MSESTNNLSMAQVKDYMTSNLITVSPETAIDSAVDILVKYKISGLPVVDELGNLCGMLSEKDCLQVFVQALYNQGHAGEVRDFMTDQVTTVNPEMSLIDVATKFIKEPFKRFPVLNENNALIGQISRADVLRAIDLLS